MLPPIGSRALHSVVCILDAPGGGNVGVSRGLFWLTCRFGREMHGGKRIIIPGVLICRRRQRGRGRRRCLHVVPDLVFRFFVFFVIVVLPGESTGSPATFQRLQILAK